MRYVDFFIISLDMMLYIYIIIHVMYICSIHLLYIIIYQSYVFISPICHANLPIQAELDLPTDIKTAVPVRTAVRPRGPMDVRRWGDPEGLVTHEPRKKGPWLVGLPHGQSTWHSPQKVC